VTSPPLPSTLLLDMQLMSPEEQAGFGEWIEALHAWIMAEEAAGWPEGAEERCREMVGTVTLKHREIIDRWRARQDERERWRAGQ
jgi:hypothetical protein